MSTALTENHMSVVDPAYWSDHVAELSDVLLDSTAPLDTATNGLVAGIGSDRPARLTMSVEEAALALGISRAFAYQAVYRGEIPHIRIGRRVLIPRAALEKLVEYPQS